MVKNYTSWFFPESNKFGKAIFISFLLCCALHNKNSHFEKTYSPNETSLAEGTAA